MKTYNSLNNIVIMFFIMFSVETFATGDSKLVHMDVDLSDQQSLQRGAKIFVNYCLSCHSAKYMRYNRMGSDLSIKDQVLKENLMFGTEKVGDVMDVSMREEDSINYFGVAPPDLSVIARSRGADWLYSYFLTFYKDESRPFGVNNLVYKDTAMPHVLWELQGIQRLASKENVTAVYYDPTYKDYLELLTPGKQTERQYDRTIRDLVNYLVYISEPIKLKRTKIGVWVMFYLFIFLLITYMLKKDYWKDIH